MSASATQIEMWIAAINSPAALKALAAEARTLTMDRYTELFAQLNLGPERTEAFARLLDDRRQTPMDLAVANYKNGIDPRADLDAFETAIRATRDKIDREIQTFLGEAAYQQYAAYNVDQSTRTVFIRMGRILDGTPDALTAGQTAQLQALLATGDGKTLPPEKTLLAREFLSPPQVAALERTFAQKRATVRERIGELPLPPGPDEK